MDPTKRIRKNSESPAAGAMAGCVLPEDIMLCILTRLPVKSIHRFKSVCKPLRDVLSSTEFVKMHRAQFPLNPENQSLIFHYGITKSDRTIWTISMLKIDSEKKRIPSPQVYYFADAFQIIGCCNGLICMDFLLGNGGKTRLALCNPALNNMSVSLPVPEMEIVHPNLVSLGFGYNEEADDFKVIKIANLGDCNKKMSVAVYSSNSNSWSKIDVGFHFAPYESTNSAIVNGSPYWEATVYHRKNVLVCFDVREMVFKIVPRPDNTGFGDMLFVDWKGDLGAIMCSMEKDETVWSLDVWVLDDVGKTGWTKKYSFGSIEVNVCHLFHCWKNGKILIGDRLVDGKLFMFDTENGVVIYEAENEWWPHVCGEYTESLAYIKGMDKQGTEDLFYDSL
ncbi:hypothetical protein CASFOL_010433 [Castilleja foliolosa]|uniref:F-box domain-containing protein n=1 Tax=Castilleja foliolosa TaxID=1961234 RepID=A0ABD3DSJ8_9LAMI